MIPALVPWYIRFLPYGAALALLAGVYWYIDHKGYQRAEAAAERRQLVAAASAEIQRRKSETAMLDAIGALDTALAHRIAAIEVVNRTIIQPRIEREISSEPRLSDPAAGITDGLREALNIARSQSACATAPDGSAVCALSPAEPVGR